MATKQTFFPGFEPVRPGDEDFQTEGKNCGQCHEEFHFLLRRKINCEVCGGLFCKSCCKPEPIVDGHLSCGACTANANIIVHERYEGKREEQLKAHFAKYHEKEAQAIAQYRREHPEEDPANQTVAQQLYGRDYEALFQPKKDTEETKKDPKSIGINKVNYFPGFIPLREGDEHWESGNPTHCCECKNEFHPLTHPQVHCTVCGLIYCNKCCKPQEVFNDNNACGCCCANALVMINEKYAKKREDQLKAHFERYHKAEAAKKKLEEAKAPALTHAGEDDLYGPQYEKFVFGKVKPESLVPVDPSKATVNKVNYFPSFIPLREGDEHWESGNPTHCCECKNEFHPLTHPQVHCTVCGLIYCNKCCKVQEVFNDNLACGCCVANALVMINEKYAKKREDQLKAHFKKYHKDEAAAKEKVEKVEHDTDELYGKEYDALQAPAKQ